MTALLSGTDAIVAEPTVSNAFGLYVNEINQPDPRKRKSQIDRMRRIEGEILRVTGQDLPLSKVQRAHARKLRDNLKSQKTSKSPNPSLVEISSVKRNLGIAKTVFNFIIREYDMNFNNPFEKLDLGKDEEKERLKNLAF